MRRQLFRFFALLLPCTNFLSACTPPLFFADIITHYYYGQNLDLLNSAQPFDAYSLFQYIFDAGIYLDKELSSEKKQSATLKAQVRMKGIFGNAGSCLSTTSSPIKIGWARTETSQGQQLDTFLIWMRELALSFSPTENKNNFFKIGLFPFKIGNGLVLGNAYKIKIPIPGQYVYEQIDQFRPGLQIHVANARNTVAGIIYVGIIKALATQFSHNAAITNIQNLETPFAETGSGKGNFLTLFQMNLTPDLTTSTVKISPYVLFQHSNQTVEFFNDATSTACTPGIYGTYEQKGLRISFEYAKNFGHQQVKKWDRNQLIQTNGLLNTQLFYVPDTTIPLTAVDNDDFTFSSIVIRPASLAESYGNGNNFLYSPSPGTTFIFKNSYDRLRNSYKNTYTGFLTYLDFMITEKNMTWGIAGAYASGADNPNATYDTLMMTRLTPGIRYKDHNKKYKGFVGIEQLFEGKSINPLYFAQAQKMNTTLTASGELTTPVFTNQCFIGSTLQYALPDASNTFTAQATVVTYFQPSSVKKGLSATLWQEQSLDFTSHMLKDMNTPLPHYLGTELNISGSYTIGTDLTFSLFGALFFPGNFYKKSAGKIIPLLLQTELDSLNFSSDETVPITLGDNTCFFISAALTCYFDSQDFKHFFKKENV
jgi:hypothetical protein